MPIVELLFIYWYVKLLSKILHFDSFFKMCDVQIDEPTSASTSDCQLYIALCLANKKSSNNNRGKRNIYSNEECLSQIAI